MFEIPESTLRSYGLTLESVAAAIRARNVEVPGGQLRSEARRCCCGQRTRDEWENRLRSCCDHAARRRHVTLNDIGRVRDEFEDVSTLSEINGKPAVVVNVERTRLKIC